jgi:hypothetical protein
MSRVLAVFQWIIMNISRSIASRGSMWIPTLILPLSFCYPTKDILIKGRALSGRHNAECISSFYPVVSCLRVLGGKIKGPFLSSAKRIRSSIYLADFLVTCHMKRLYYILMSVFVPHMLYTMTYLLVSDSISPR